MTLPKQNSHKEETPEEESKSVGIPTSDWRASHAMIPYDKFKSLEYRVKVVKPMQGMPEGLNKIRLKTLEAGYCIAFSKYDVEWASLDINRLKISIIKEEKKGFLGKKKEDLMVELICKVSDFSTEDDAVLKFNDEIAQEIVGLVEEFKQFNSNYWEQVEYTTFGSRNKPKRVILFPNAPFTGDGEEVIWQNVKTNKEKTISGIDVITNCRVMQYDYVEQTGVVAMLDNVQDVVPQNVYMSSNRKPIGFYPPSLPPPDFNTIMNVKLLGDLTIYVQNTSAIVFTGVTDPAHLAIMIKTLKNKQNQAVLRSNVLKKSLPADQIADTNPKVSELNCSKCGNAHIPSNSKFCNLCGSALSPICPNCSHLNPSGSAFCSKCGSKIVQ